MVRLAIDGGNPVRYNMLPYGRQTLDHNDFAAVADALSSDFITTGPLVEKFEQKFAKRAGAKYAVALSSGTAALHAIVASLGITDGEEVIVPTMTFVATANCVKYCGGTPIFVDIDPATLLIDPEKVIAAISSNTVAIVAVDYAGHPNNYSVLNDIANKYGLALVSDACHSLGGKFLEKPVGSLADLTAFSFHPVKHITTGEGGMVTSDSLYQAKWIRRFRSHGRANGEMVNLGYNYRITDIQCALGLSQLDKLDSFIADRRHIAEMYDSAFANNDYIQPLFVSDLVYHSYHLYVIKLNLDKLTVTRDVFLNALRAEGIGSVVHYKPVHMQPFYFHPCTSLPNAEHAYKQVLSLPLFPGMTRSDVFDVINAVDKVVSEYKE